MADAIVVPSGLKIVPWSLYSTWLLHTVLLSLDKKNLVGGLFCELQKVFDCVNHNILLAKLEFYSISGIANKLMRSYLKNRYQRVVIRQYV